MKEHRPHIYGVIGEFEKPEQLVHAATKIREAGYRYYECYTPFPVEGMPEAMAMRRNDVPLITLIGGLIGGLGGFGFHGAPMPIGKKISTTFREPAGSAGQEKKCRYRKKLMRGAHALIFCTSASETSKLA